VYFIEPFLLNIVFHKDFKNLSELSLLNDSFRKYLFLLLVDEIVNNFDPSFPEIVPFLNPLQILISLFLQEQLFGLFDLLSVFEYNSPIIRQKSS
jgi:hypothetical protein